MKIDEIRTRLEGIAGYFQFSVDFMVAMPDVVDKWNDWIMAAKEAAAKGYEVQVTFDDGVTQDRQTNLNEGVMLVGAGLLSKYKFLTDKKLGQGLTDKEATDELQRIRDEHQQTVNEEQVRLYGGGA